MWILEPQVTATSYLNAMLGCCEKAVKGGCQLRSAFMYDPVLLLLLLLLLQAC
jgi:hypothetical protein